MVKKLIGLGANVNTTDLNGASTIMWAIYKSDLKMVKLLVKYGADVKKKGIIYIDEKNQQYYGSPLAIAAGNGNLDIVIFLIEKMGVLPNDIQIGIDKKEIGRTALHEACTNGHSDIVEYLLEKGADINAQVIVDSKPMTPTPLICAAKSNHFELVKYLLEKKADPDLADEYDFTPLAYAVINNNKNLINLLLSYGANINYPVINGAGILMLAAYVNNTDLFRFLVWKGADVKSENSIFLNKKGFSVHTVSGMAAARGNIELIEYLRDSFNFDLKEDKILIGGKETYILPLLHVAILANQEETARFLVNQGCDVNQVEYNYGLTALIYAAYRNNLSLIKFLLEKGADINFSSKVGYTALTIAARDNYTDIVRFLLENGADPTISNKNGEGAYYYALTKENEELKSAIDWRKFLSAGKVKYPSAFLYQAILAGVTDTVEIMLKFGLKPDLADINGNKAMIYAVKSGKPELIELLLRYKADLNCYGSENPLCIAIETNTSIAEMLINYGADINAKSSEGNYPVFQAINFKNYEILNLLIQKGVNLSVKNDSGLSLLHLAVRKNDLLAAKALIAAGVPFDITNAEEINADKKMLDFLSDKKISPIELIDQQLEWSIANLIKKHPELANEKDSAGFPVLHRLVRINEKELIQQLVQCGINLNITDSAGRTALYYAVWLGNTDLAKYLLTLPIDINLASNNGDNAVELASKLGYTDLVNLMSRAGGKTRKIIPIKPEIYVSVGHTNGIVAIDISADGRYLLSLGADNTARLWEISSGKEIKVFNNIKTYGLDKNVFYKNSIRFSPDGNRFLVNSINSVEEYDIRTGIKLRILDASGHSSYSPDGRYILSGGTITEDKISKAYLIDSKSGKIIYNFSPPDNEKGNDHAGLAAFSPDGKIFAIHYNDILALYKTESGKIIKTFNTGALRSFSFSPDGTKVVFSDKGRGINVLDLQNGKILTEAKYHPGAMVCFSPDGKIFASGGHDQLVILWDATTGEKLKELFGHNHHITALKFSPDGKYLFSSSTDQTIIMWEVNTGKKIMVFGGNSWQTTHVSFSPDGKYLVCSGNDYAIKIWDLYQSTTVNHLTGHKGMLFGFVFSPDSLNFLSFSEDRIPRLWNFTNGKRTATFRTHEDAVLGAGFSPDGKYCFTYSNDGKVILWDVVSEKMILKASQNYLPNKSRMIILNQNPSSLFCFTPDSKYFISGDTAIGLLNLIFWDISNGKFFKKTALIPADNRTVKSPVIRYIGLTPDRNLIVCVINYKFNNGDYSEIHFIKPGTLEIVKRIIFTHDCRNIYFTPDGKFIIAYDHSDNNILIINVSDGKVIYNLNHVSIDQQNYPVSPDGKYLLAFQGNKIILLNLKDFNQIRSLTLHSKNIISAGFSPDGKTIVSCALDNTIKLTDTDNLNVIGSLIQIGSNDWVVTNDEGLFDASGQAMKKLYYVAELEIIELEQMKERYYEPNLLPKLLGYNKEKIRDVRTLDVINLFPEVEVNLANGTLEIDLTNRGGGIGKVVILINNKEIASDARGPKADPNSAQMEVKLDLKNHPYLIQGKDNVIEVKAYNADGYLVSRGSSISYNPGAGKITKPPHLYVIACGVSDYTGEQIDLKFAAKDAEDVGNALKIGGERLFGADKTHIFLMTTNAKDEKMQPTKDNILRVFMEISTKATSDDVFVLYLSGHGINWGGQDGDFYYLTKDAYSASPEAYGDPKIRASTTISSTELTDLFKKIPALKQVMMIDACASGKTVENLIAKRDISTSTLRALDRMKDRVGMYIITGCAADAVSFEASKFGQGLLTYSLLEGIKGISLREERFIDIAYLFNYAQERVPELAADIGGIQKPQIFSPYGSQSFDIGELSEQDKQKIILAQPKPMFLMSVFLEEESMDDILGLEKLVDDNFRLISSKGLSPIIFVQAKEFPEAYRIRGQYTIKGDKVEIKINLFKGKVKAGSFTVSGNKNEIEEIIMTITDKAMEFAK